MSLAFAEVVFLVEWWSGSRAVLHADPNVVENFMGKEHALLLLNHGCEVDWLMGWAVCDRVGVLGVRKKAWNVPSKTDHCLLGFW